jgi:hypothetical protein
VRGAITKPLHLHPQMRQPATAWTNHLDRLDRLILGNDLVNECWEYQTIIEIKLYIVYSLYCEILTINHSYSVNCGWKKKEENTEKKKKKKSLLLYNFDNKNSKGKALCNLQCSLI